MLSAVLSDEDDDDNDPTFTFSDSSDDDENETKIMAAMNLIDTEPDGSEYPKSEDTTNNNDASIGTSLSFDY